MTGVPANSHAAGFMPAFARVHRAAQITNWNGATLPFDVVDSDPLGLWDAVNHAFAPKAAGWYEIAAYGSGSEAARFTAFASNGIVSLQAIVNGAGNNLTVSIGLHTADIDGAFPFPPVVGHTHMTVGDSVEVDGTGGTGYIIPALFAFAIVLVLPD